ncbi:hypothetical protein N7508_011232 [Penicillium antarcticum]|uniref:uncharacterized protein n=1 Tax=Penicillium antarcticum TaxID=416450 RepID=UPI0023945361|nr:uncharacterized protein N7508_011232 [Penicillium antarcticum]KAJ5288457.1 hypothetical protein N7508_011232 [Penicillium antarcticum]
MSVKPKGQLLEAVVYLKRDSNPPLEIGTKLPAGFLDQNSTSKRNATMGIECYPFLAKSQEQGA